MSYCVACKVKRHMGIILSGVCLSVCLGVRLSGSHTIRFAGDTCISWNAAILVQAISCQSRKIFSCSNIYKLKWCWTPVFSPNALLYTGSCMWQEVDAVSTPAVSHKARKGENLTRVCSVSLQYSLKAISHRCRNTVLCTVTITNTQNLYAWSEMKM